MAQAFQPVRRAFLHRVLANTSRQEIPTRNAKLLLALRPGVFFLNPGSGSCDSPGRLRAYLGNGGAGMSVRFPLPTEALAAFCQKWRIVELAVFGSALREDFGPQSDIDFLARFASNAEWSLFDHAQMELELSALLGRDVDLVSRRAIEQSRNWVRRQSILESTEVVYAA